MPDGSSFPVSASTRKRAAALPQTSAPAPAGTPLLYAAPGFSIEMLGRQLATAEHADVLLDNFSIQVGSEKPQGPLNRRRLQQRHTDNVETSLDKHTDALRELILASRPETLVDALVSIMVASGYVRRLEDNQFEEAQAVAITEKVWKALYNSARAIGAAAGVPLAEVGGVHEVGMWCDPWPLVSVGFVHPEDDDDRYADGEALDGSAFQGAAA